MGVLGTLSPHARAAAHDQGLQVPDLPAPAPQSLLRRGARISSAEHAGLLLGLLAPLLHDVDGIELDSSVCRGPFGVREC